MENEDEDTMREFADWMNPIDERILEYLRDEGVGTPNKIADHLSKHNNYIGERCRKMLDHGLVERVDRGVYIISNKGEDWLDEKIGSDALEDLSD